MSEAVLGIDLGTTNSVVAVADQAGLRVLNDAEGHALMPSVVSFLSDGSVSVGRAAHDRRLIDAKNTVYSVKRLIGRPFDSPEVRRARERFPFTLAQSSTGGVAVQARGESYTLSEISAFVLRQVRANAEAALGESVARAVITVPANFNELQRSATKAAGRVAGLEVMRILNEPTAAALAYGFGQGSRERVAIFDLGGGTFDITILDLAGEVFEVLATAGDTYLGGDDVDALVATNMADAFLAQHRYDPREDAQAFERLRVAAEWLKCQLSDQVEVQVRVEELAYGPGGSALDLSFGLSRASLDELARPLVSRCFDVCEDAMKTAGVRPTQIDNVILVGGSTRIPLVRAMVADYFGRAPIADLDPDRIVAQGAALQARALSTARAAAQVFQVSAPLGSEGPPSLDLGVPAVPVQSMDDLEIVDLDELLEVDAPPVGRVTAEWGIDPLASAPAEVPAPAEIPPPEDAELAPPPLLLDVTPLSLGVETAGGFCEVVIGRNSAIPVEQTRVFSTARDEQTSVTVRIAQGESRRFEENQPLGEVLLEGLPAARRGAMKVGVTFVIDADGTLDVFARNEATGEEASTKVQLIGALPEADVEAMQRRQREKLGAG